MFINSLRGFQRNMVLWKSLIKNIRQIYLRGLIKHGNHFGVQSKFGGGIESHIPYEEMDNQEYAIIDIRQNILDILNKIHPRVNSILGDCQKEYAGENTYDRVIAIYVLEHLPNLPEALKQMHRILVDDGVAHVVIPCEGSLAYTICIKISAERLLAQIVSYRLHVVY